MQQHIDCSKEKQFQYIFSIIRGKGEPFYTSDGIAMFPSLIRLTDPLEAMDIFAERYNNNEIEFPFKYGSYIAADDLQDIIKGLQLDADAFWLLIMFCFDYAYSVCLTGFTYNDNEKETIEKFIALMCSNDSSNMKLSLKTENGNMDICNKFIISNLLKWIKQGYEQSQNTESNRLSKKEFQTMLDNRFNEKTESNSKMIWLFASLLKYFFELNPQFDGKHKRGINKNFLISKLIYYTHISTNDDFRFDTETLKGFFKQYKGIRIETHSSIYPDF